MFALYRFVCLRCLLSNNSNILSLTANKLLLTTVELYIYIYNIYQSVSQSVEEYSKIFACTESFVCLLLLCFEKDQGIVSKHHKVGYERDMQT